jgi:uncharacterized membrane protein
MLTIMSWGLGGLFAVITLLPVLPGDATRWIFLGVLVLPLALLAVTLLPLMRLSEEPGGETDQTPDDRWLLGMFYFNREDPALMAPKRHGLGYSPNFAQPLALLFFGGAMLLVLAPLALLKGM